MTFKVGTNQDDILTGTNRSDYIFGLGGNDILNGLGGNDYLDGGDGDDTIDGGDGCDWLFGGNGNDSLVGSNGNDYLDGGEGNDTLNGGAGNDRFLGSVGSDYLIGGNGNDIADYCCFGQGVTLRYEFDYTGIPGTSTPVQVTPALRVVKDGGSGIGIIPAPASGPKDTLESVETIIGAVGQTNTINFAFESPAIGYGVNIPAASAPAITVDLAAQTLTYNTTTLNIQNFSNVIGSAKNDTLLGDHNANVLDGFTGSNVLNGRGGNDILKTFENDILTGGDGADQFTLKASWKATSGRNGQFIRGINASTITDFTPGVDTLAIDNAVNTGSVSLTQDTVLQYYGFTGFGFGSGGYGNYTVGEGRLAAERFLVLGSSDITAQTLFIYDGTTGDLFYRGAFLGPGSPGYSDLTKVATLQGAPTLTANDILVI